MNENVGCNDSLVAQVLASQAQGMVFDLQEQNEKTRHGSSC